MVPLPVPDFLKDGLIRAGVSFAEIPSNINIKASQDRINKLQTRLDDITSGKRRERLSQEFQGKNLQRELNEYFDEKGKRIKGDPVEYYTKEIQKEKENFAKNYIDSKEYEPILEALGNNAFF